MEYYDNEVDAVAQVSWTGGGTDTTPPTITARTPAPGASGVSVSVSPTATFSEPLNPATLTSTNFTLVKQGTSTPVAATVCYASQVATLDPTSNLEAASTYTATVKGGSAGVKDVAGNALAADSTWTFTTDATPPTSCPAGQYTADYFANMTLAGSPAVTRCENAPLNYNWGQGAPTAGVPADHFSVRWDGQFTFPAGATTFTATADDGIRLYVDGTLVINAWVDQGATTYTATRTLTAGTHQVRVEYYDNEVDAVAQVSWTGGGTDTTPPTITARTPAPGATGVSVSVSPTATFSEPMNASTVTSTNFTLVKQGTTTPVAATVSYASQVATLDPTSNLEAASTYTATVKGGTHRGQGRRRQRARERLDVDVHDRCRCQPAAGARHRQPARVPHLEGRRHRHLHGPCERPRAGDASRISAHLDTAHPALPLELPFAHDPDLGRCRERLLPGSRSRVSLAPGATPERDRRGRGECLDVRAAATEDGHPDLRHLAERARARRQRRRGHCALHQDRHRRLGELGQRHHAADPERNDVHVFELVGRRCTDAQHRRTCRYRDVHGNVRASGDTARKLHGADHLRHGTRRENAHREQRHMGRVATDDVYLPVASVHDDIARFVHLHRRRNCEDVRRHVRRRGPSPTRARHRDEHRRVRGGDIQLDREGAAVGQETSMR